MTSVQSKYILMTEEISKKQGSGSFYTYFPFPLKVSEASRQIILAVNHHLEYLPSMALVTLHCPVIVVIAT
jgi:hypothetical protein